jgi:hypothetical protein
VAGKWHLDFSSSMLQINKLEKNLKIKLKKEIRWGLDVVVHFYNPRYMRSIPQILVRNQGKILVRNQGKTHELKQKKTVGMTQMIECFPRFWVQNQYHTHKKEKKEGRKRERREEREEWHL